MPELPEVEILRSEIEDRVKGKRIRAYSIKRSGKTSLDGEELLTSLIGAELKNVRRRGKLLILELDNGLALVVHMMLIGQVLLVKGNNGDSPKASLALHFEDGDSLEVRQVALKALHLVRQEALDGLPNISELGIDALSADLTLARFRELIAKHRGPIKKILGDQTIIAGIGNTYSDELLFSARVHPERDVRSLSDEEITAIYNQIRPTLKRGIDFGGSSAEQFVHLDGSHGHYQEHFLVHRRGREPCKVCGTKIEKVTISGRSSYFCPNDQPAK